MEIFDLFEITDKDWNKLIVQINGGHFLMSSEWIEIKREVGWKPYQLAWRDQTGKFVAFVLVLEKKLSIGSIRFPFSIHYAPKGPLLDWQNHELANQVFKDLEEFSKKRRSIFLKIDPDVIDGRILSTSDTLVEELIGSEIKMLLKKRKWGFSDDQIQFKNTVWLDLTKNSEQILAEMKQKTRYNIRLAQKKGVLVRKAKIDELNLIYKIYEETALRDNFTIRNSAYYLNIWRKFLNQDLCDILVAEFENKIIAGLVLFYFGDKAYYVYGMSTNENRNLMPTYLIQWEAILHAKKKGKSTYDLWGAPELLSEDDSMWGVYRFKRGLGGDFISTIGAWDFVVNPFFMKIYKKIIPAFLNLLRKIAKTKLKSKKLDE